MTRPLIIGIGNEYRGDDAAGLAVTRSLEGKLGGIADIAYCPGNVMNLLYIWEGRERVILIDTVTSGEKPVGFLHHFHAESEQIPALLSRSSTHVLGIVEVIELARSLGTLPHRVTLYGIEGKEYGIEMGMSASMQQVLTSVTEEVETAIQRELELPPS